MVFYLFFYIENMILFKNLNHVFIVDFFFFEIGEEFTTAPKRTRGPSRGLGLEKLIKGSNKMHINIPKGKGRPTSEVQSAKLSNEIGLISRQFIAIPTKWKGMTNDDKNHAMERLKVRAKS
jgi:hypothetical protein